MRIGVAAEQAGVNAQTFELLHLRNDKRRDRGRIRTVAGKRVRDLERTIAALQAMRKALAHLVHFCEEGATLEYRIIEALDGTAGARP